MRRRLACAFVVIVIILFAALYVSGSPVYRYQNTMSGNVTREPSPEWSTLQFQSSSDERIAEFNFSTTYTNTNNTQQGVGFGFSMWHAQGFSIESVNLTFYIGPSPADVWVTQFDYYTDNHSLLRFENTNFTGGATGVSGAFITLSGFPPENPTTLYGVGLTYKDVLLPAGIGSTSVIVQMVLVSGSGMPFVGEAYTGQFGFNLVYSPQT